MKRRDLGVAIFLLIFSLLAYLETHTYPYQSAYFPRIIIGMLALMAFALLGKAIYTIRKEKRATLPGALERGERLPFWRQPAALKVVLMIICSLIYLVAMSSVGFFVTTLIYLPVMIRLLGVRKVRTIALSSIVVVFFIYLIFSYSLKVPLPQGIAF